MISKIDALLKKIDSLKADLSREYEAIREKYGFSIIGKKVVFSDFMKRKNRSLKENVFTYVLFANIRKLLSLPFIYSMVIPAVILDIFLFVYQSVAFSLYRIPKVKRSEYIVYDRQFLDYLNIIQKGHCLYCTYVNGLFAYAVEIGGRTERYWCPIKAAKSPRANHAHYQHFADYGDAEGFKEVFNNEKCFSENGSVPLDAE